MFPTKFPQATKELKKPESMTDEECGSLHVYSDGEKCISLWRMTWRERLSALFFGRCWVYVYTAYTQPPITLSVERSIFSKEGTDEA